ncbi:NAD(P)H-dependent oxidoreductase [Streptomyces sp. NPDC097619]|uniref:FMN-dependent NADH-azoreductase n=1 Tax=Streptomyces sp. NPDC097619 TaxID=3157228 RepID=UPI0033317E49
MSLFRLDASIFPAASAGAEIADTAEAEWAAARPGLPSVRRHLGTDPLPSDAWALATAAAGTPESDRTHAQRDAYALAVSLADELRGAEAVILAVPLYNFGVSQHFKAWVDLVIAAAGPTTPLLKGIPTLLVTTLGGGYGPGTPREGWDHSTPYLKRILADVWEAELVHVQRELTLAATTPALAALREPAAALHARALTDAREAGRTLVRP